MPNLFSFLRGNRLCRALFTTVLVCLDQSSLLLMWTTKEFEALNLLHYSPVDENGDVLGAFTLFMGWEGKSQVDPK